MPSIPSRATTLFPSTSISTPPQVSIPVTDKHDSRIRATTITVYDSSPTSHYEKEIDNIMQGLTSYLDLHETLQGSTWKIHQQRQHQQSNSDDCGIFVLIFALSDATGSLVPSPTYSFQWKQIFRYSINPTQNVISNSVTTESDLDDESVEIHTENHSVLGFHKRIGE